MGDKVFTSVKPVEVFETHIRFIVVDSLSRKNEVDIEINDIIAVSFEYDNDVGHIKLVIEENFTEEMHKALGIRVLINDNQLAYLR